MKRRAAGWLLVLAILAGAGVGGWFAGSRVVAPQPDAAATAFDAGDEAEESAVAGIGRRSVASTEAEHPNQELVLGATGLSPFGHQVGLAGRQVLVGTAVGLRATDLNAEIDLITRSGQATISVRDGSTFVLRLSRAAQSELQPGDAVAILLDQNGAARAVLALPSAALPELDPGIGGPGP